METNLFNAMFQQSAIAMAIVKVDGTFIYVNDALCELTGYKKESLINETNAIFTHPEDLIAQRKETRKLIKGEIPFFQMEKRYIHKKGHIVWGLISVNLIFDEIYKPKYVICQVQNITEKKEMERRLIENENKYRLIAENSSDRIVTLDLNGKYKYISPSVSTQLGYSLNDLKEIGPASLIHDNDKLLFTKALQGVLESDLSITVTYRIRHKNGYYVWTEANVKCIFDRGNGNREILLIGRDISERKLIEVKLKQSEERYRRIVEHSPEMIAVLIDDKIEYINPAGVKLLGAENKEEIIGKDIWNFYQTEDHERVKNNLTKLMKGKNQSLLAREHTIFRLDGTPVTISSTINTTIYNGKRAIQAIVRDITEAQKLDEWMQKSEKLSLVGQLAAGVAHEVRNPLTSIKGFMQLVKSTKEFKEFYVDIILSELDRTEAIIYEFLSLAKPNEERQLKTVNFNTVLEKVISLLETQALMQNVNIHYFFTEQMNVDCDENQMKQVFINLIQNAIEASKQNDNITITLQKLDKEHIKIEVKDEGCGIPKERLKKLGEPFYSTKEKGTGLGLLVTYKIIESHNGKLTFSSEEGNGTTVEIILPRTNK